MTPKALCDLAVRINTVVPGLVPEICEIQAEYGCGTWLYYCDDKGSQCTKIPFATDAAAMMLGLVFVKRRQLFASQVLHGVMTDIEGNQYSVLKEAQDQLEPFVSANL